MCEACARDYADPTNRRFHAEPIACQDCGPKLNWPVSEVATALRKGKIVALKGLGGFHLLCDAHHEAAVQTLRRRKGRDAKPFAVMVTNLASAERLAELGPAERALLSERARPIVLARSRGRVCASVAPSLADIGLMLAYTPLHSPRAHALAGLARLPIVARSACPTSRSWRPAPIPAASRWSRPTRTPRGGFKASPT